MWSAVPLKQLFDRRVLGKALRHIESVAVERWEIAPGERSAPVRAFALPGQLDRVTSWAFSDVHPRLELESTDEQVHAPTRAFLLRDAWLIDGVLYCRDACAHLHPRSRTFPTLRVIEAIDRAAVYCTPGGNRYFGQWLLDDCLAYPLAVAEGVPVTTGQEPFTQGVDYERLAGMSPRRVRAAYLREAVIFDDVGQNRSKHVRARRFAERLRVAAGADGAPHPGVFVVRGLGGTRRLLVNELELAERLRARYGLRVIDPLHTDVREVVAACAGAQLVVGVEGSHLVHAIPHLPPGGRLLTLQPPDRFLTLLKHLTDRDGQHFGYVVGEPREGGFYVDPDEVERTLDLFPA